jgi:hypothetical protein
MPVMMMSNPNFDLTFASAATAKNKKKLASNSIFSINKSPHHDQVYDDQDDYYDYYRNQ